MNNIIDIHVHRTHAGKYIPFDKVYLVPKVHEPLIPRIFGYAVVLPLSKDVAEGLFRLRPKLFSHKHFRRNDADKNQKIIYNDRAIDTNSHTDDEMRAWWEDFAKQHALKERLVVVPVLTSVVRRKIRPRYLGSRHWQTNQHFMQRGKAPDQRKLLPTIDETGYLATPLAAPNDKIEPICSICPRCLLHMQGDCQPGDLVCYKSLDFAMIADSGEPDDAGV